MGELHVDGPFPLPVSAERQKAWAQAVLATPGVNVPLAALENVAPFIVDPELTLSEPDAQGVRTLKGGAVRRVRTEAGDMVIAVVRMHGAGGVVWGHNERISSIWRTPADPTVDRETKKSLTPVRPWRGSDGHGQGKIFAALESSAWNRQSLVINVEETSDELRKRDKVRPYDLLEDLVLNGQQEPGMYVPQMVRLEEKPEVDEDGNPLHPAEYWGWMAVRGNNRTQKRHEIFGLTSTDVLTGVPAAKLGRSGKDVVLEPGRWLAEFSEILNKEHAQAPEDEHPQNASRARRAASVAVVDAHLVIGTETPQRLYRIVQMSNRRDHVHPPLEFDANDRSRALGRSVLGMYVAQGVLDERTAEVLSGLAPVRDLPGASAGMSVSELRDLRSMRLLDELFPKDQRKRLLLRRVLSESPPSQLKGPEINQRARTWSALTSESYPEPWNPRIGEIFTTKARDGFDLSGRPLGELLAAADSDDAAFDELVTYRAAHWLAAFDIIDADRGSLAGQQALNDAGEKVSRVRRSVTNCLQALRHERSRRMAVGLLRELAAAMDEGDRPPWRVSGSGTVLPNERMTPLWFDLNFPKETGMRPRKHAVPPPRGGNWASAAPATSVAPAASAASAPSAVPAAPALWPTPNPTAPSATAVTAPAGSADADAVEPAGGAGASAATLADSAYDLEERLRRLLGDATAVADSVRRLSERARDEAGGRALTRRQADDAVLRLTRTITTLRTLPEAVEDLAEPS
ncbi:hypothetical protein [Streptomyces sp. NPDC054887]